MGPLVQESVQIVVKNAIIRKLCYCIEKENAPSDPLSAAPVKRTLKSRPRWSSTREYTPEKSHTSVEYVKNVFEVKDSSIDIWLCTLKIGPSCVKSVTRLTRDQSS
jgi:hypothetical protein